MIFLPYRNFTRGGGFWAVFPGRGRFVLVGCRWRFPVGRFLSDRHVSGGGRGSRRKILVNESAMPVIVSSMRGGGYRGFFSCRVCFFWWRFCAGFSGAVSGLVVWALFLVYLFCFTGVISRFIGWALFLVCLVFRGSWDAVFWFGCFPVVFLILNGHCFCVLHEGLTVLCLPFPIPFSRFLGVHGGMFSASFFTGCISQHTK